MNKIYYLKTCDTCRQILKNISDLESYDIQELKQNPITEEQLEELRAKTGSYENLFNKRAQLYKERGLKDQTLEESDYKKLILEHYTFLSRPIIIHKGQLFIGKSQISNEMLKDHK